MAETTNIVDKLIFKDRPDGGDIITYELSLTPFLTITNASTLYQTKNNIATTISGTGTSIAYPSTKAVVDYVATQIENIPSSGSGSGGFPGFLSSEIANATNNTVKCINAKQIVTYVGSATSGLATTQAVTNATANLVNSTDLTNATANLVNSTDLTNATANLVNTTALATALTSATQGLISGSVTTNMINAATTSTDIPTVGAILNYLNNLIIPANATF